MTGPEKTDLIYAKYTYSYYGICLLTCMYYTKFADFIEILNCIHGKIFVTILIKYRKLLHLIKDSKLGQNLLVDKNDFLRLSYIYNFYIV